MSAQRRANFPSEWLGLAHLRHTLIQPHNPNPPSKIGNPLVYPCRWTSTPRPHRPHPQTARTGPPQNNAFSSPPCSKAAASLAPRAWRGCRGPARIGCVAALPARPSTRCGTGCWPCTPGAWPIRLPRTRLPPHPRQRRAPDARAAHHRRVAVTL